MRRPFLTARWEHLLMLNYRCPREWLEPLVPDGTTLDSWRGETVISLVAFLFKDTRVKGIRVPGHSVFEEVNLRLYVRRDAPDGSPRRAVVFIRELVPRRLIATAARRVYNEPYLAVPMSHEVSLTAASGGRLSYSWRHDGGTCTVSGEAPGVASPLEPGSEAEFITEHYWGYTRQRDGSTLKYEVRHPRWDVWTDVSAVVNGPAISIYGSRFADLVREPPRSAFVAVGSAVEVFAGQRVR